MAGWDIVGDKNGGHGVGRLATGGLALKEVVGHDGEYHVMVMVIRLVSSRPTSSDPTKSHLTCLENNVCLSPS